MSLCTLPAAVVRFALLPLLDTPAALALCHACGCRAHEAPGRTPAAAAAPASATGSASPPPPADQAECKFSASTLRRSLRQWVDGAAHRRVDGSLRAQLVLLERAVGVRVHSAAENRQRQRQRHDQRRDEDEAGLPVAPSINWTPELIAMMRAADPDFDPAAADQWAGDDGDDDDDGDGESAVTVAEAPALGPHESEGSASGPGAVLSPAAVAGDAWAAKCVQSEPHALNSLHLWARCVWWIHERVTVDDEPDGAGGAAAEEEEEEQEEVELASPAPSPVCASFSFPQQMHSAITGGDYRRVFPPHWWSQLTCGLLLPVALQRAIQQAPSSLVRCGASASALAHPNPLQRHFLRLLLQQCATGSVARPPLVLGIERALARLLPASAALVEARALWVLRHGLSTPPDSVAGLQITPFVLPWPTTRAAMRDLITAVRANPIRADGHNPITGTLCSDQCPSCQAADREREPLAHGAANDTAADSASTSTASVTGGCSSVLSQTQLVRGCVWWRCDGAGRWLSELLLSQVGVSQACLLDEAPSIADQVPGHRNGSGFSDYFAVAPPSPALLESIPVRESLTPLDPSGRAAALLSAALPWSLGVITHASRFEPHPSFLVAPLAPGFVGGFAGSSTGSGGW